MAASEGCPAWAWLCAASLFGYGVGQFDFSRPLQRPGKGWVFQFSLSPGF